MTLRFLNLDHEKACEMKGGIFRTILLRMLCSPTFLIISPAPGPPQKLRYSPLVEIEGFFKYRVFLNRGQRTSQAAAGKSEGGQIFK